MSPVEPKGPVGTRREVGDAASSQKHPPHVDENMEDAPIQDELPSPQDVPTLPATAHGEDNSSTEEQAQSVDPESMYENRPEEHKDIHPGDVPS